MKSTCRELLDLVDKTGNAVATGVIAARVERVLTLRHAARRGEGAIDEVWGHGWNECLDSVLRLLDGEEQP